MSVESRVGDEIAATLRRSEETLLDTEIRRDRAQVAALLMDDFKEFGSSGRIWKREQVLDLLTSEKYQQPVIENFHCALLTQEIALVTYCTASSDTNTGTRKGVLHSSLWIRTSLGWRLRFHQGTICA